MHMKYLNRIMIRVILFSFLLSGDMVDFLLRYIRLLFGLFPSYFFFCLCYLDSSFFLNYSCWILDIRAWFGYLDTSFWSKIMENLKIESWTL